MKNERNWLSSCMKDTKYTGVKYIESFWAILIEPTNKDDRRTVQDYFSATFGSKSLSTQFLKWNIWVNAGETLSCADSNWLSQTKRNLLQRRRKSGLRRILILEKIICLISVHQKSSAPVELTVNANSSWDHKYNHLSFHGSSGIKSSMQSHMMPPNLVLSGQNCSGLSKIFAKYWMCICCSCCYFVN